MNTKKTTPVKRAVTTVTGKKKISSIKNKSGKTAHHPLLLHGEDILRSKGFRDSDKYIQHGTISVMRHSLDVAKTAVRLSRKLHLKVSERDLVRGALLHDYFGYDWHGKKVGLYEILHFTKMHGFTHPGSALKNAERDFSLNDRQRDIIKKHMWPLTVKPPACKEAWVVTLADKYCSLLETLHLHK